jgi:MSHA type pilus biogenesis protein MshL
MVYLRAVAVFLVFAFGGCSLDSALVKEQERPSPENIAKQVTSESSQTGSLHKNLVEDLEKTKPKPVDVEPLMPVYDPLEDHMVSFSMVDEDFKLVLYSLAQSVGMNLIIDPEISNEKRLVTLNFQNVSAATVLREILKSYDLFYEIDHNVIRIKPFEERFFELNFLDTTTNVTFDVGGDVLGAGSTETAGGLSGKFKLSGKGGNKGNTYDILEQMIQKLLSKGGKYSLNRIAGSLYIKDTPAVIRSASHLINHLKDMLARQVLIEARIIEVGLSDQYSYGIDWEMLRQSLSRTGTRLNRAAWSLGQGLILSGVHNALNLDATINALKTFGDAKIVSNPSIRCKHGKPAIISVGTSLTYKKRVETTTTTTTAENLLSTDVEVSTVFDGLILGIVPFIQENGRITLLINPIKSDVDPTSIDPVAVSQNSADSISLPKVSIKEISTTIGLRDGDEVFLGGLIDKHHQKVNKGFPVLSRIPVLGFLFKNDSMEEETRELVIVLKVTVI